MKAHDSYLTALLKISDGVFNIPVYQRNYDWGKENCQQLFNDLETITETDRDHFIGSIVYISVGTATEPYYNIIDGQQRITSVMLFLKALHDSTDDEKFKKRIDHGFLLNIGLDGEPKMKLKQVESDRSIYEKLILQQEFDETAFTETEKQSNVYCNYSFFKKQIEKSGSDLQALYNAVFKLEIIDVCLTTEDPQEVFESMNSTGKALTNTDLLRNYLLMDLTASVQENLYKKYWAQIEKNVGLGNVEIFMVHYLIMKRKTDSIHLHGKTTRISKTNLYDYFKLYYPPSEKNVENTENLLNDMSQFSAVYRRIVNNSVLSGDLDKAIHELYDELNSEPPAIFMMYLIGNQEKLGVSDEELTEAIKACISYVFRVRLFKGTISNQFFSLAIQAFERCDESFLFIDRVWTALTSGQGSYRFPKDREFKNAFATKNFYLEFKPPMLRYILYKYERKRTKEVVEPENATIEHILPQETKEWRTHLMEINDDVYEENIHKIGNLTLTKMNSEASNDAFEEKKKVYANSGYKITRDLVEYDDWNSKEIIARSASMAAEALELWPLPEKYNIDVLSSEWNMDEETEDIFNMINELVKEYDDAIYEEPWKMFINYVKNGKVVLSVIPNQSCLYVVLNEKVEKLTPNDNLEDISQKGHWGTGDSRMRVSTEDDVFLVLDYVAQIIGSK